MADPADHLSHSTPVEASRRFSAANEVRRHFWLWLACHVAVSAAMFVTFYFKHPAGEALAYVLAALAPAAAVSGFYESRSLRRSGIADDAGLFPALGVCAFVGAVWYVLH